MASPPPPPPPPEKKKKKKNNNNNNNRRAPRPQGSLGAARPDSPPRTPRACGQAEGLDFGVWGLGFGVFGVWGLGFGV